MYMHYLPGKKTFLPVESYQVVGKNKRKIQLYGDDELEILFATPKMLEWIWRVEGFPITNMIVTEVVGRLEAPLFVSIAMDILNVPFRVCARIRGDSMGIKVRIKDRATGSTYALLVRQNREPAGFEDAYELTAGMGDGARNILWPASKELWDELGIRKIIPAQYMQWVGWIASSMGLLDEIVHIFSLKLIMSHEQIMQLQGRQTGDCDENILVRVVPDTLEEVLSYAQGDPKSIVAELRLRYPHLTSSLPVFKNIRPPLHDWDFNFNDPGWVDMDSLEDAPPEK